MIGMLTGVLVENDAERVLIDVGGVGYSVIASRFARCQLPATGQKVALHIHTHVREDQLALYGFCERQEKELFCRFISVSGIGPKSAMNILSHIPAAELMRALYQGDADFIAKAPGVGKKIASRIIMELKDKLIPQSDTSASPAPTGHREELCSALINLGYSRPDAEVALKKVDGFEALPFADAIRLVLRELART